MDVTVQLSQALWLWSTGDKKYAFYFKQTKWSKILSFLTHPEQ